MTNEVNKIISLFVKTNEAIKYSNKTERSAAEYLINKYGFEKAVDVCEYAISLQSVPYAPVISSPYELKMKLAKLKIYQEREFKKPPPIKKLYYWGMEVREKGNKLYCIPKDGGEWMEFTGSKKDLKTDPCG